MHLTGASKEYEKGHREKKKTEKEYRKSFYLTSVFHFLGSVSSLKQEITDISLLIILSIFLYAVTTNIYCCVLYFM